MLGVDLERGQRRPGSASSSNGASTTCAFEPASAHRLLEDREHRHGLAAPRRLGLRDHDLRLARLEPLRDGGRGEAGEDRHLDRADVRDRVRGDRDLGRHRQEDRDAVARLDAERDELLGEPRHVARELGERQLAARAVLAEPDRGDRVRPALGPAVDAVVARSRRLPPTNHVAHSGPRDVVVDLRPTAARTRGPCRRCRAARTTRAPATSGAASSA